MELEFVLLGLISMHQGLTGYELNRIMRESTGYLVSSSFSHIYPSLKKLHDRGLVSYRDLPIKNRLSKKIYHTTPLGEEALKEWLSKPIEESPLEFRPFLLKMSFSPLMSKQTILDHIDREIKRFEHYHQDLERDINLEVAYLDKSRYDQARAEVLWKGLNDVGKRTNALRLAWLQEWRLMIEEKVND